MYMLNQPFNGQLGNILSEKMSQQFNEFTILSAFAKNSGVLRLKPAMEQFISNGGTIKALIGIDAHGTSYEALLNLFHLCNCLYVIHSESLTNTFHSKIYSLSNKNTMWLTVGSNNLTGGGLWTNFESAICLDINLTGTENQKFRSSFLELVTQYEKNEDECSKRITSDNDLLELLNADYIRQEVRIQSETIERRRQHRHAESNITLFGTHGGIHLPQIAREHTDTIIRIPRTTTETRAVNPITETDTPERIWFETKAMTGGSRNILDLSKLGSISNGSAIGSRYETDNPQFMLGGVAFFDIEPEDSGVEKDITINYNAVDYSPCTIKFTPDNGSWRIQLKGEDPFGIYRLHTIGGTGWLVQKILIFEKIRTDYYCMSVVEKKEINSLKTQSYVVAHNGSGHLSKLFGLLL